LRNCQKKKLEFGRGRIGEPCHKDEDINIKGSDSLLFHSVQGKFSIPPSPHHAFILRQENSEQVTVDNGDPVLHQDLSRCFTRRSARLDQNYPRKAESSSSREEVLGEDQILLRHYNFRLGYGAQHP
jgi:hypothetical protein